MEGVSKARCWSKWHIGISSVVSYLYWFACHMSCINRCASIVPFYLTFLSLHWDSCVFIRTLNWSIVVWVVTTHGSFVLFEVAGWEGGGSLEVTVGDVCCFQLKKDLFLFWYIFKKDTIVCSDDYILNTMKILQKRNTIRVFISCNIASCRWK